MKTLLLSEKRLQADFREVWQILNPVSDRCVTLKNQDDKWNTRRNKKIMDNNKEIFKKGIIT